MAEHLKVFIHKIPIFDSKNRRSASDRVKNVAVGLRVKHLNELRFPKGIFCTYNGARSSMVERLIVSQDHAGSNPVVHPR